MKNTLPQRQAQRQAKRPALQFIVHSQNNTGFGTLSSLPKNSFLNLSINEQKQAILLAHEIGLNQHQVEILYNLHRHEYKTIMNTIAPLNQFFIGEE